MALIGKIREKSWLLVVIIGIALVAFVLGDYLRGSNGPESQFGYGTMYGEKVDVNAFEKEVNAQQDVAQAQKNQELQQQGRQPGSENALPVDRDRVWQSFNQQAVFNVEYEALGVSVSEEEFEAYLYGEEGFTIMPEMLNNFKDSTGQFSQNLMRTTLEGLRDSDQAADVRRWEGYKKYYMNKRKQEKYLAILGQGVYVTNLEAQNNYLAKRETKNISYVVQRYNSIKDTKTEVSEESLKAYYEEHKNDSKYQNRTASRTVNFFDIEINPSAADSAKFVTEIDVLKAEFALAENDSLFVINKEHGEFRFFTSIASFGADDNEKAKNRGMTYPKSMDSLFKATPVGSIVGPYVDKNSTRLAKVIGHNKNSISFRHILIPAQKGDSIQEAVGQRKVDSLMPLINSDNFVDYMTRFTADQESVVNGGKYEDLLSFEMPTEIADFAENNTLGKIGYVKSPTGFHIIEILKKEVINAPILAVVQKTLSPSQETINKADEEVDNMIYLLDDELLKLESNSEKVAMFDTLVRQNRYVSRPINIESNNPKVSGFETVFAEDKILKLAFDASAEVGNLITSPIKEKNRYIIAILSSIKEVGAPSYADAKQRMEREYTQDEKAKEFIEQMNNTKLLSELTSTIKGASIQQTDITFANTTRFEVEVVGAVFSGLEDGATSKPIKGQSGVYVVKVEKTTDAQVAANYVKEKMELQSGLEGSLQSQVTQSLVKLADIVDNRKFYFKNIRR